MIPVPELSIFININFHQFLSTETMPLSTHIIQCLGDCSHIPFSLHFKMPKIVKYFISLMITCWWHIKIYYIKCIYWCMIFLNTENASMKSYVYFIIKEVQCVRIIHYLRENVSRTILFPGDILWWTELLILFGEKPRRSGNHVCLTRSMYWVFWSLACDSYIRRFGAKWKTSRYANGC